MIGSQMALPKFEPTTGPVPAEATIDSQKAPSPERFAHHRPCAGGGMSDSQDEADALTPNSSARPMSHAYLLAR